MPYPIEPIRYLLGRVTTAFEIGIREPGVEDIWWRARRMRPIWLCIATVNDTSGPTWTKLQSCWNIIGYSDFFYPRRGYPTRFSITDRKITGHTRSVRGREFHLHTQSVHNSHMSVYGRRVHKIDINRCESWPNMTTSPLDDPTWHSSVHYMGNWYQAHTMYVTHRLIFSLFLLQWVSATLFKSLCVCVFVTMEGDHHTSICNISSLFVYL